MQLKIWLNKIKIFTEAFRIKNGWSRCFVLLAIFFLAVVLISFIIPVLNFGRFFGTDDYTHLFHTKVMISSNGLGDFYKNMGDFVSDPASVENDYNYPFGLWLLGAAIVKITGLPLVMAELLFAILFLLIIFGSFYVYSSTFLESKEQKLLAVLFLLSMPSTTLILLSYRPSVFILPFLFILLYIVFKEPVQWKLFPVVWLSLFVIIISHTGTFIFLISFSIIFFLLYCLVWGKISYPVYFVILSSFILYVLSLEWFPRIAIQYIYKSTIFLSPGNLIERYLNISIASELGKIFYQEMLVNQELIYFIIFGAFIFTTGKLLIYVHRMIAENYSPLRRAYPLAIPSLNISHSGIAAPIWIGPIHVIFSLFGFTRINSKGKCILITTLLVTLLPEIMLNAQDINPATGSLREISYLTIIIPITAALGLWEVMSYLGAANVAHKKVMLFTVWLLVLLVIIITPIVATTYYSPKIAGEDYINDGMKWLGETGDLNAKVIGYGYRTVPIYTNMTDAGYGLLSGSETRTVVSLLKGIYFASVGNNVNDLRDIYGVKYILMSDKLIRNLGGTNSALAIDNNHELNKIFSSKDFGVYEVVASSDKLKETQFLTEGVSFQQTGSSLKIVTDVYKVVLNANNPYIEQFGTTGDNYLGGGIFRDYIQISGLRYTYIDPFSSAENASALQKSMVDRYNLNDVAIPYELKDNQIIYKTILKDQQNNENQASLLVRYTFYPKCIKREFIISHDWVTSGSPTTKNMGVVFTTRLFSPLNDFIIINNENQMKRHMYPNQDSVELNRVIRDLFIHDGERGIYIKNAPTATYPTDLYYAGSTLYNLSSLGFSQSESLTPGASLHITQFLAPGDETTAKKDIETQEGISLLDYPGGMIPIMLSGYRTPYSNVSAGGPVDAGYQVLRDDGIPYSEVVVPYQITGSSGDVANATKVDLRKIADKNSKIIVRGSVVEQASSIAGSRLFENFTTQEQSLGLLIDTVDDHDAPLIGFMPELTTYNLDTLKILAENQIPVLLSRGVSPPYRGSIGLQDKYPQIAVYHNSPIEIVLLPVSSPMSDALSARSDYTQIFTAWNASVNEAAVTNGMLFLIIRSEDIGDQEYTENFKALFAYANEMGLTFTTPDIVADHLRKMQNIKYSGSVKNDAATINLTNNNDVMVPQVTFKIVLPVLKNGPYSASGGKIVKTKADKDTVTLFISTDISAQASKIITVMPEVPREKITVTTPPQPIEGGITISIEDKNGNPLTDAYAIIDSRYYKPDEKGNVHIDLPRGVHTLEVQCPGYDVYNSFLNVKGRIYFFEQLLKGIT
jgi:hypothetical protein